LDRKSGEAAVTGPPPLRFGSGGVTGQVISWAASDAPGSPADHTSARPLQGDRPLVASRLVLISNAGDVGRTVLDQLRAQDVPARVMVRREDERAAELRALGGGGGIGD